MTTFADLVVEAQRLRLLSGLEEALHTAGFEHVAGVDEVGRGCLAGPVVAAAVIPRPDRLVPGVNDSKEVAPEVRQRLAREIRAHSLAWAVKAESAGRIDRTNILRATERAMVRAVDSLDPAPSVVLVDAVALDDLRFPRLAPVRGDLLCYSIACASILAKVERDSMMRALDREYPQYGFSQNKGYGAPAHLEALAEFGPSPVHRLTFRSVLPRAGEGGASTPRTAG